MFDANNLPPAPSGPTLVSLRATSAQNTNIGTNDHVKFDTLDVNLGNGLIIPDVSSAYTQAVGPSNGRITLAAGYVYRIYYDPGFITFSSSSSEFPYFLYEVNAGITIQTEKVLQSLSANVNNFSAGVLDIYYAPTTAALIELRIDGANVTNLTSIGHSLFNGIFSVYLLR